MAQALRGCRPADPGGPGCRPVYCRAQVGLVRRVCDCRFERSVRGEPHSLRLGVAAGALPPCRARAKRISYSCTRISLLHVRPPSRCTSRVVGAECRRIVGRGPAGSAFTKAGLRALKPTGISLSILEQSEEGGGAPGRRCKGTRPCPCAGQAPASPRACILLAGRASCMILIRPSGPGQPARPPRRSQQTRGLAGPRPHRRPQPGPLRRCQPIRRRPPLGAPQPATGAPGVNSPLHCI
jgi:hypothetical protein